MSIFFSYYYILFLYLVIKSIINFIIIKNKKIVTYPITCDSIRSILQFAAAHEISCGSAHTNLAFAFIKAIGPSCVLGPLNIHGLG